MTLRLQSTLLASNTVFKVVEPTKGSISISTHLNGSLQALLEKYFARVRQNRDLSSVSTQHMDLMKTVFHKKTDRELLAMFHERYEMSDSCHYAVIFELAIRYVRIVEEKIMEEKRKSN